MEAGDSIHLPGPPHVLPQLLAPWRPTNDGALLSSSHITSQLSPPEPSQIPVREDLGTWRHCCSWPWAWSVPIEIVQEEHGRLGPKLKPSLCLLLAEWPPLSEPQSPLLGAEGCRRSRWAHVGGCLLGGQVSPASGLLVPAAAL